MNKKMVIIFFLISFFALFNNVNAEENKQIDSLFKIVIEDDANILSKSERNLLMEEMRPLSKYGNIIFKSINTNNSSTSSYASNYYHTNFSSQSGTLFLIDMANREIYIFSDGNNYNIINNDKAYIITDNVYRYASNNEYYKCGSVAFSQIKTLLDGGKILEPMRYISNFLVSIIIAFFINYFIVIFNSRVKKANDKEILYKANVSFAVLDSNATKIGSHSVYDPVSDSGGSSSSSGGGGGGGGSSGGGGGHSF